MEDRAGSQDRESYLTSVEESAEETDLSLVLARIQRSEKRAERRRRRRVDETDDHEEREPHTNLKPVPGRNGQGFDDRDQQNPWNDVEIEDFPVTNQLVSHRPQGRDDHQDLEGDEFEPPPLLPRSSWGLAQPVHLCPRIRTLS